MQRTTYKQTAVLSFLIYNEVFDYTRKRAKLCSYSQTFYRQILFKFQANCKNMNILH